MDQLDDRLLLLLQKDGRASATVLAEALGVSRGTVQNRIDKLLKTGVIKNFSVELGQSEQDHQVNAFTMVKLRTEGDEAFKAALRRIEEVTEIATLSGHFDIVIEIRCGSLKRLDLLLDKIRLLPDVADTQSHIRLRTISF